jgi:hypothetical protein
VHVVWNGQGGIQYRERSTDGTWSSTVIVNSQGSNPALAVDDLGIIHVTYNCISQYCGNIPEGTYYV